jgi:hypothetical protein
MPISTCPHCDARVRVPENHAGSRLRCPKCAGRIHADADADDHEDDADEPRPPRGRRQPKRPFQDVAAAAIIWVPVAIWSGFWFLSSAADVFRDRVSAPQQAASAAIGSMFVISGYVMGRAANFMFRG